jgi:hypothetical protein
LFFKKYGHLKGERCDDRGDFLFRPLNPPESPLRSPLWDRNSAAINRKGLRGLARDDDDDDDDDDDRVEMEGGGNEKRRKRRRRRRGSFSSFDSDRKSFESTTV